MKKINLNPADKTLLFVGIIFLVALVMQLKYKGNLFFDGLFFCAEAALVGGIADWFAVTALFEKPWGFPYHTRILPRRREEFITACVKMVQQEFFRKKQLINRLKENAWQEKIILRLTEDNIIDNLKIYLWQLFRDYLIVKEWETYKQLIKDKFMIYIRNYEPCQLQELFIRYVQQDEHGKFMLTKLTEKLQSLLEDEDTVKRFEKILVDFQAKQLRNPLMSFLASIASSVGILDMNEAAKLLQQRISVLLKEFAEPDSVLRDQVLNVVREKIKIITETADFQNAFIDMREKLINDCGIEESIDRLFDTWIERLQAKPSVSEMQVIFDRILSDEIRKLVIKFQSDEVLQADIKELLYDVAAHGVLQAQAAVSTVVRTALMQMTEEQLNLIVRDKIEPDLIWIRINGSLVGAIIGLGLFTILTAIRGIMG